MQAVQVVQRLENLYVDRKGGFIGTEMKGEEEVGPCANLDDVLVIRRDRTLMVSKVVAKKHVSENIEHVQFLTPEDRMRAST